MLGNDLELLRQFACDHAQDAFTELVRRHVNLVFSAALRQVHAPQLAEEVVQSVFTDLAHAAGKLPSDTILTAWLYQVTRRTAIDVIRKESRRQLREQIAVELNDMNTTANEWTHIEPQLDDAMAALDDTDRSAILLRYFENKTLREVGEALGTSDDAAQKRVSRAVERLRDLFVKRGITVGAGGLVVVISANAVQAAPAGLIATISAAAVLGGTAISTSSLITATKTIAMTTLQKSIVATALIVAVGTAVYEARRASPPPATPVVSNDDALAELRGQLSLLATQNTELASAFDKVNAEKDQLEKQLEQARHNTELFRELASQSNAPDGSLTNNFPTKRHVFAEMGRKFRQIAQLKNQDTSGFTQEEKAANDAATINLIHDTFNVISKLDQFKTDAPSSDASTVDEGSCILYGVLNLNDQQFSQVHDLVQKYHEQAVQQDLTKDDAAPEAAVALKQLDDQLKAELQNSLTPEQAATFAQVSPGLQLIKGHFEFSLDMGDKAKQTAPAK